MVLKAKRQKLEMFTKEGDKTVEKDSEPWDPSCLFQGNKSKMAKDIFKIIFPCCPVYGMLTCWAPAFQSTAYEDWWGACQFFNYDRCINLISSLVTYSLY